MQFLRYVLQSLSFAQANLDTGLIPREAAVLFNQERVGLALAAAADVAQTLLDERAAQGADPFSTTDGWRSHGVFTRRFEFEFRGAHVRASLTYLHDGALSFKVGDAAGVLAFARHRSTASTCNLPASGRWCNVYRKGEVAHIHTAQGATQIIAIDLLLHAGEAAPRAVA